MSGWKSIRLAELSVVQLEHLTEDARSEEKGGKGGFSVSVNTGRSPKYGFMISDAGSEKTHPFDQDRPHLSVPDLRSFIQTNQGLLAPNNKYFGGWLGDNGRLYLDVSSNINCRHKSDSICPHRLQAYFAMLNNRQLAIYHINGEPGRQFLDAGTGKIDFPEHADLFEQHEQFMKKEARNAARRNAREQKANGGKVFFRLGPDATDEELLEVLNQIAGK